MATQGMYANQGVCQAKDSLADPEITLFVISQCPQVLVWQALLQEYKDINPFSSLIILGKLGQEQSSIPMSFSLRHYLRC